MAIGQELDVILVPVMENYIYRRMIVLPVLLMEPWILATVICHADYNDHCSWLITDSMISEFVCLYSCQCWYATVQRRLIASHPVSLLQGISLNKSTNLGYI